MSHRGRGSQRYAVVVIVDVPGTFSTGTSPEHEKQSAARLVSSLLRDASFESDIAVTVGGAIELTTTDVDWIALALQREVERGNKHHLRALVAKMTELRAAVDHGASPQKERS